MAKSFLSFVKGNVRMKLYVMRHGETEYNLLDRVCGISDVPLTEKGIKQAEAAATQIKNIDPDLIFVSPLIRAQQTAEAALGGRSFVTEPRLTEENFGVCEGVSRFDETFIHAKRNIAVRQPGGESFVRLCHRVYSLIEDTYKKYPDKKVLWVCHGTFGRAVRTYFVDMTNDEIFEYAMGNCEICEYEM